jgi:hypothetical protein
MNNSVINGNIPSGWMGQSGGGVYFNCTETGNGSFFMNNSDISGNIISAQYPFGGGVSFGCSGIGRFVMTNSRIEDNKVETYGYFTVTAAGGGGVSLSGSGQGSFTMTNSVIRNNTGFYSGGGVSLIAGTLATSSFTMNMNGGEISGNTVVKGGGGVYVSSGAVFIKEPGGIIYGKDEGENSNLVKDSSDHQVDGQGHTVYIEDDPDPLVRDHTAGPDVTFNGITWSDDTL